MVTTGTSVSIRDEFDRKGFSPGLDQFPDSQRASSSEPVDNVNPNYISDDNIDLYDFQLEADSARAERAREMRNLVGMAQSGVLKNDAVGLKETQGKNGTQRKADNGVTDMVMSEAYKASYNNQVSFKINGQDFDMLQGEIHDFAKNSADQKEEWLRVNKDKISAEERAKAEEYIRQMRRIAELTDPNHGKMTAQEQQEFQGILDSNPEIASAFEARAKLGKALDHDIETIENARKQLSNGEISQQEFDQVEAEVKAGMSDDERAVMEQRQRYINEQGGDPEKIQPIVASADFEVGGGTGSVARSIDGVAIGNGLGLVAPFTLAANAPADPSDPSAPFAPVLITPAEKTSLSPV